MTDSRKIAAQNPYLGAYFPAHFWSFRGLFWQNEAQISTIFGAINVPN